jgi:hypothetical protein
LPQVGDDPATPGSVAKLHVASEATADDRSALPTSEIRIFIHHVADQRDAALAQRLADYLRGQGFTVADIRPVEFSIGKPSVRALERSAGRADGGGPDAPARHFAAARFRACGKHADQGTGPPAGHVSDRGVADTG